MAKVNGTTGTGKPTFDAPYFDRLNYFYGQMLGVSDFCAEQSFFREKIKLHNRCLHGYGTVCGLRVLVPEPKADCTGQPEKPVVYIEPGLALDSEGNELIVRADEQTPTVDLWESLSPTEQQTITQKLGSNKDSKDACYPAPLFVCLHFRECPLGPSRPITVDSCGGKLPNVYGKFRDGIRISVSLKAPAADSRCETCCCQGPCDCDGLLIAQINRFHPARAVKPEDVHNEVRRRIGTYTNTTITGVNWHHGRDYHRETVRRLLHEGLVIHFSRPVMIDPLQHRGVVDVYHIESRSTRHPNIIELRGEISPCSKPTQELRYRITHLEECPESRDRLLIVVRCGFILDECCRPVDGLNVGGRVPHIGNDYLPCNVEKPETEKCQPCDLPPWGYAPWASGNGNGGGTFESWIYVEHLHLKGAHHDH